MKLAELQQVFLAEAARNKVLPIDDRTFDGRVRHTDGTVSVDEVYVIKGDVGLETGNIHHTGSVLIEEAGGVVTDMDGGPDFLESGNVVCGSPGVHSELLEEI